MVKGREKDFMRMRTTLSFVAILMTVLFLNGVRDKNVRNLPSDLRDAVADASFEQLLGAVPAGLEAAAPPVAPQQAQASTALPRGPGLLTALHEQTTLNGAFRAGTYPEAKFFMYSQADVTEKDGVQGILEVYSQTFMEGVAGIDGCHVECEDANGDGHVDFDDYTEADRNRCVDNEFIPSGIYPIAKCGAGAADFNRDGRQQDFVNAEHLWPQARFGKQADMKGDLYNLLPTFAIPNARRGDSPYGPGGFMPPKEIRGQIARAIFYFATAYYDRIAVRDGQTFFSGMIPGLMEWNRSFPPTGAERKRNNLVSGFQGNRNPYIDNPALVDQVGESAWSNLFR